jgi:hypothetical protein
MPDAAQIAVASLGHEGKEDAEKGRHDFEQHDKGVLNPHEQPEGHQAPQATTGPSVPAEKP